MGKKQIPLLGMANQSRRKVRHDRKHDGIGIRIEQLPAELAFQVMVPERQAPFRETGGDNPFRLAKCIRTRPDLVPQPHQHTGKARPDNLIHTIPGDIAAYSERM